MAASDPVRLTAAVLTYNGRELLEVVLPSLAAQSFQGFETVVVDNGSGDDTLAWLAEHWPEVKVVSLPVNVGVTAALNVCLSSGGGDYLLLLNNDIELDPECVGELLAALDANPGAGSAAAKLLGYSDRGILDGTGDIYEWSGEANRRGQGERDEGQFEEPCEIFGACGGAALYRRSAIAEVGPFDEQLFAIYEDVDWAFRAQLLGYSCRYVPSAVVYHMGSKTIGEGLNDFALYHGWRNSAWVVAKNFPASALARHGWRFANWQAHNLVWAVQEGRVRIFYRSWRDVLRGLPAMLRKRRAVQRTCRIGLAQLEQVVEPLR